MKRALVFALIFACRAETKAPAQREADPPVSSESAIPEAPVSGTIHGAPFVARDMRYVVDDRIGYEHVDVLLSAGKAEDACGRIAPERPTSVWLRLEGKHDIARSEARDWSVHFQVFDEGRWLGLTAKKSLLVVHAPTADGRLTGGVAVCFGDDANSCVSGSFDATSCPATIDQPVRGANLERMLADAGK